MAKLKIFLLFFAALLESQVAFSQAQVFPTRLILTEESPSSYLNLRNSTTQAQKYQIDLAQFQMFKDGTQKRTKDPNHPLLDLLKFSPKATEVSPADKQVVRAMMTSFDGLKDGEYVIYLHFVPESIQPAKDSEDASRKAADEKKSRGGSLSLQAKIAVAVPVIVRKGTPKFDGKLSDLSAATDKAGNIAVTFKLHNSAAYFLTGDLEIFARVDDKEVLLSKMVGLSSYIPEREVRTVLTKKDLDMHDANNIKKIRVAYTSNSDGGAPFALAGEADLKLAAAAKPKKK